MMDPLGTWIAATSAGVATLGPLGQIVELLLNVVPSLVKLMFHGDGVLFHGDGVRDHEDGSDHGNYSDPRWTPQREGQDATADHKP